MSNEQWASLQRRKTTCFERVGGEKCKMFQLNVRGEESRQLCVGTSAPRLQDEGSPTSFICLWGPGTKEGASLSRDGHRQQWLFLGSRAGTPQPRCICGHTCVDVEFSLQRQCMPTSICEDPWELQHLLPEHCVCPQSSLHIATLH